MNTLPLRSRVMWIKLEILDFKCVALYRAAQPQQQVSGGNDDVGGRATKTIKIIRGSKLTTRSQISSFDENFKIQARN